MNTKKKGAAASKKTETLSPTQYQALTVIRERRGASAYDVGRVLPPRAPTKDTRLIARAAGNTLAALMRRGLIIRVGRTYYAVDRTGAHNRITWPADHGERMRATEAFVAAGNGLSRECPCTDCGATSGPANAVDGAIICASADAVCERNGGIKPMTFTYAPLEQVAPARKTAKENMDPISAAVEGLRGGAVVSAPDFWAVWDARNKLAMAQANVADARMKLLRIGQYVGASREQLEAENLAALEILGALDREREEQQAIERAARRTDGGVQS